MHKTGWRQCQKGSLIPGQPHRPLERDKTEESLSGPLTQEAALSSRLRSPALVEWILKLLGAAGVCYQRCSLGALCWPTRRLSHRQPHLLMAGLPQRRVREFMGSMCLVDINVRSVTQPRGGSRCPGSVTAGFKWSDVCSGCQRGRMLLRSPLEASIVNSFIFSKSPLSRGQWGRLPRGPGLVVDTSVLLCADYSLGQPVFQSPLTLPLKSGYFSQESAQQKGLHKDTHVHNRIVCDSNSNNKRDKMNTINRGTMLF